MYCGGYVQVDMVCISLLHVINFIKICPRPGSGSSSSLFSVWRYTRIVFCCIEILDIEEPFQYGYRYCIKRLNAFSPEWIGLMFVVINNTPIPYGVNILHAQGCTRFGAQDLCVALRVPIQQRRKDGHTEPRHNA